MAQQIQFVSCTQAQYDAATKASSKIYFITDTHRIYKGSDLYGATDFDQITFSTLEASSLTVNGSAVALDGHTHTMAQVTGLDASLTTLSGSISTLSASVSAMNTALSGITSSTITKASGTFTTLKVGTSNVALSGHTHSINDVTNLSATLTGITQTDITKTGTITATTGSFTNLNVTSTATFSVTEVSAGNMTMSGETVATQPWVLANAGGWQEGNDLTCSQLVATNTATFQDAVTVSRLLTASGGITAKSGITVTSGGILVSSGGIVVSKGGLKVSAGVLSAMGGISTTGWLSGQSGSFTGTVKANTGNFTNLTVNGDNIQTKINNIVYDRMSDTYGFSSMTSYDYAGWYQNGTIITGGESQVMTMTIDGITAGAGIFYDIGIFVPGEVLPDVSASGSAAPSGSGMTSSSGVAPDEIAGQILSLETYIRMIVQSEIGSILSSQY